MTLPWGRTIETILLVESRSALRKLVAQILEDAQFTVIAASSAKGAIRAEAEFPGTIGLLLSGLSLTGMSGPNLARRLKEQRPQMHVMLMSGYPGGALLLLNCGWQYIEKPFVASVLVSKVKDILRGEIRDQPTDRGEILKVSRRPFGRASSRLKPAAASDSRRRA